MAAHLLFLLPLAAALEGPVESASLELGAASGQPGETVEVPVLATFDLPMQAFFAAFTYDPLRLEFLEYDAREGAASAANTLFLFQNTLAPGHSLFGLEDNRNSPAERYHVPPGVRQLLGVLRLRILATADRGASPVDIVPRIPEASGGTIFILTAANGGDQPVTPRMVSGSVMVLEPEGPRPVGGLQCEQFLDRVKLSFTPTETYDRIDIFRGTSLIATLGGSETAFMEKIPGQGKLTYSVLARKGELKSVPAACVVIAVAPAAPVVKGLTCGDDGLSWTSPVVYDRLTVLRNGEHIADLPGDAQAFTDPSRPDALTVYTVLGELEGFQSPDANCLDHGIWIMEVGDVQTPLNSDRVVVPMFVTTSAQVQGVEFHLEIDQTRFEILRDLEAAIAGTVGDPNPEFFGMGHGPSGEPAAGILWDHLPPNQPEKDLSPGLRQHVLNFIFHPVGIFSEGDTFLVTIKYGDFALRIGTVGVKSQVPDLYIPGRIKFGSSGALAVKNLIAKVEGGGGKARAVPAGQGDETKSVSLSWQNGSEYDKIRLERNGVALTEISGDMRSYLDRLVGNGVFTYKVIGLKGNGESFPTTVLLSTVSPPGAFLRGDANRDDKLDIADPIALLNFLFRGAPSLPCEDAADANDDGALNLTDVVAMIKYFFLGSGFLKAPGTQYPWFDPTLDGLTCKG